MMATRDGGPGSSSFHFRSVFDEEALRDEFQKRGANSRLIPLIWKHILLNENAEAHEVPGLSNAASNVLRSKFKTMTSTLKAAIKSKDHLTTKLLIQLQDRRFIEAVIMSYDTRLGIYAGSPRPGGPRATLCVSSQVGCKMGCTFCATGSMGFQSNLSAGEIVEQLVHASRLSQIRNVVFMGMGEPLNNYSAVVAAVRSMTGQCFQLAPRHITISTVGVIHGINGLKHDLPNVNLAVSLHAPLQDVRCQIMPAARAFPLAKLMDTLHVYQEHSKRKIFIEYIMLDGINDQEHQAHQLGKLLETLEVVVNLIPFNPIGSISKYKTSSKENVELFQKILRGTYKIRTTVRQEMGQDISGACGQLLVNLSGKKISAKMEQCGETEEILDIEDLSNLRDLPLQIFATAQGKWERVREEVEFMYKRIQKNLTSEELLHSLWDKCKADFRDKHESIEALLAKYYPTETLSPSFAEMKELFKTV